MNHANSQYIADFKRVFNHANHKERLAIADSLVELGGDEVVAFFISSLDSEISSVRNCAALGLRDLADTRAVQPLINAVLSPIDSKKCATLAYALEMHDCSHSFLDIFRILFYGNWECKQSANVILSEQKFAFSNEDLYEMKAMWDDCILNPDKCPAFDELRDAIQDDVDSFWAYASDSSK